MSSAQGRRTLAGRLDNGRVLTLALLALGALAVAIRLVSVLRGGGLTGVQGFDDGVYLSAAIAFTEGRIPYQDFNLLHPPGIIYTLTPFAALGALAGDTTALAAMRLAFIMLGGVNTILVGLVGRRALGPIVAVASAAVYAVWSVPVDVERTAYLVGPQNLLLLVALAALAGMTSTTLTWRRAVVAGACLGASGALQVWAVLPALVIFLWLVVVLRRSPRQLLQIAGAYVAAGLLTVTALLGPMLLAAGPRMVQLMIWTQLSRDAGGRTSLSERIRFLEGFPVASRLGQAIPDVIPFVLFAAAIAIAVVVAWRTPVARLWTALLLAKLALLFYAAVFFRHYAGWIAPEAALLAGAAMAMLLGARLRPQLRGIAIVGLLAAAVVLVLLAIMPAGRRLPLSAAVPDLRDARCVAADAPILLVKTGAFRTNLERGCPILLNPGGLAHILNAERPGPNLRKPQLPEYQDAMRAYFGGADAALFSRGDDMGMTDDTRLYIESELPVREVIGHILVLRRR